MEIKFRARALSDKEWVHGYYVQLPYEARIYFRSGIWVPVDPKTVGRFTGLLDKNRVEIYEGDKVKIDTWLRDEEINKVCVAVMRGWESSFEAMRNTEDGFFCPMGSTAQNDREVIGNIYSDKEVS